MNIFDKIEDAIEEIRKGNMIIVVDDEDRENEGDFIMAADRCMPHHINFMATHGRGLICTPITPKRAEELDLPLMVQNNNELHHTAFTVSIDHKDTGTGISCSDRSLTILSLTRQETQPSDLLRPGHIFPLIAREGGVLERNGHTEAAVDLARMAGCYPAGVICEIMDEDGSMAKRDSLHKMAQKFGLKFITIKDLIDYKRKAIELLNNKELNDGEDICQTI